MTKAPHDSQARGAITERLGDNLFVEAGAGTGKTQALVERVVCLVADGTGLGRVAAITFTDAAAAELRERIRRELERAARGESLVLFDSLGRERCASAAAAFDDATITTLHGFAQRILAEHPLEAALPPGFEVASPVQASLGFRQRWTRFLDELLNDPARERALVVLFALGLRMWPFERLARVLHDNHDRLDAPFAEDDAGPGSAPVPEFDATSVIGALDHAVALAHQCHADDDLLALHLIAVRATADALRRAADELEQIEIIAGRSSFTCRFGRKENWPDGVKAEIRARLERAEQVCVDAVEAVRQPALRQVIEALLAFTRQGVRERRAAGHIEFHDLLTLARDLLRRDVSVRAKLHDRYPALLLDEFQDTDPLQIEIAVLIATDASDVHGRPWFELPFQPGRLFVVGDPKQSIYRFRRADLELYHQARERFAAEQRLGLTANFRSRPAILAWVNALFASLMTPDDGALEAVDAAPFQALIATCVDCPDTPLPVQLLGHAWEKDADLGELRRQEADELAALVAQARAEGWPVRRATADDPDHTEPANYRDIAILLPSRATLSYLEEAFDDAGVPVRIESQSLVFATNEVHDLMSILGAIDDPGDEVAVVAALRTPGFGCRDDQLVEFAQAGGHWDYRREPPDGLAAHHPVVAGMHALRDLHEQRWWESVSETVGRVIRERRLLELAVTYDRPRDHWRRTQFVADAARAFGEAGGATLRGFVDWLREQLDEAARAVEVVVPEPDDDAVRILTVHGAKGLEFPIVVLAGLGVRSKIQAPPLLWDRERIEIGFGKKGQQRFETDGFEMLREAEHSAQADEEIRLLYVAATRARDHLVVSVHHRVEENCPAATLWAPAGEVPDLWRVAAVLDSEPARLPSTSRVAALESPNHDPDDLDAAVAARAEWQERRAALVADNRRAPTISATALATGDSAGELAGRVAAPDPNLESDEPEGDRPAWRRGRAGTAIGRAVHAVLQTVDFVSGAGLQPIARAQALAEGIPERAREIELLTASVLAAPVLELARAGRAWREVPVAAPIGTTTLEGFIDLLIEGPDGLIVVDYKTDHVPNDTDIDAAVARYRVQGAAYALALESALGRPVTRVVFVFARRGGAVEREITDVRDAIGDVRALVDARAEANV